MCTARYRTPKLLILKSLLNESFFRIQRNVFEKGKTILGHISNRLLSYRKLSWYPDISLSLFLLIFIDFLRSYIFMEKLIVIAGSLIVAFAFNFFLVPYAILSSGISGIAILLGLITPLNTGLLNLVLNLPLVILGYYKLGKTITISTLICVVSLSVFLYLLPVVEVTENILLSTVFGGVIAGIGAGLILKYSGTSGGLDIIAIMISKTSNVSIGLLLTCMNGIIVFVSGAVFNWDIALYTLLSIYLTGKMIDTIFTNHVKLTMQIVTSKGDLIREDLLNSIYRGITISEGYGGYTQEKKQILMMVVTRYETMQIKKIVRNHDEKAFINIFETVEVDGEFAKN